MTPPDDGLLRSLRGRLSLLDEDILYLLAERQALTLRIMDRKYGLGYPARDRQREADQNDAMRRQAERIQLDPALVEAVYAVLRDAAVRQYRG